jgi:hypothetical protein
MAVTFARVRNALLGSMTWPVMAALVDCPTTTLGIRETRRHRTKSALFFIAEKLPS